VEQLEFAVYDLHGRMVWRKKLAGGGIVPGMHSLIWDGRDLQGTPVGSGRYVIRMQGKAVGEKNAIVKEIPLINMK
jgi:flagellar hook assembly protein FlgD